MFDGYRFDDKVYHDRYSQNKRGELFKEIDREICEKTTPYGITIGLSPALQMNEDGSLVLDRLGIPIVELKARVYLVMAERLFVPFGQTIIHETGHAEKLLEGKPIAVKGETDEHINDAAYPGTTFTPRSLEYTQYSDGHPDKYLFMARKKNKNILGMNRNLIPRVIAKAVINPAGYVGGLMTLGIGRYFSRGQMDFGLADYSRAEFLSKIFLSFGVVFTGLPKDLQSNRPSDEELYPG